MLIAEIGEPPDITEPHRVAQAGEEEVTGIVPVPSLLDALLLGVLHHAALSLLTHLQYHFKTSTLCPSHS